MTQISPENGLVVLHGPQNPHYINPEGGYDSPLLVVPQAVGTAIMNSPYLLKSIPVLEDPITELFDDPERRIDLEKVQLALDTRVKEQLGETHTVPIDRAFAFYDGFQSLDSLMTSHFLNRVSDRIAHINDVAAESRAQALPAPQTAKLLMMLHQQQGGLTDTDLKVIKEQGRMMARSHIAHVGPAANKFARILVPFVANPEAVLSGTLPMHRIGNLIKSLREFDGVEPVKSAPIVSVSTAPSRAERIADYERHEQETEDLGVEKEQPDFDSSDADFRQQSTEETAHSSDITYIENDLPWRPEQSLYVGRVHVGSQNTIITIRAIDPRFQKPTDEARQNAKENEEDMNSFDLSSELVARYLGDGHMPWNTKSTYFTPIINPTDPRYIERQLFYRANGSQRSYFTLDQVDDNTYVLAVFAEVEKSKQDVVLNRLSGS